MRGAMSGTGLRRAGFGRCYLRGGRRLVRSQPVLDPILVWWRSRGPVTMVRHPNTAEVVRHRVSEEHEHVHRYMVALEGRFDNTWQVLQGSHWSYDPVMVPYLWVSTARVNTRRALRSSCISDNIRRCTDTKR